MVGPDSSYSPLEIHICWKVLKDDKMEPPIQTEYLRSGGATTLIFIEDGANAVALLSYFRQCPRTSSCRQTRPHSRRGPYGYPRQSEHEIKLSLPLPYKMKTY